jgi:hypothetical protein
MAESLFTPTAEEWRPVPDTDGVEYSSRGWVRRRTAYGTVPLRRYSYGPGYPGVYSDECEQLLCEREAEEAEVAGRMSARRQRALAARALPAASVLDKVVRQEGHLGRQLDLTLRQLERLQAARKPASPVVSAVLTGLGAGADVAGENGFVPHSVLPNRPAVAPGPATGPPTADERPERWSVR